MAGGVFAVLSLVLKVLLKELDALAAEVRGFSGSVAGIRDHVEGEVFVGLDEVVDDLVGGGGVHIAIHLAHREHEVAFELWDVGPV